MHIRKITYRIISLTLALLMLSTNFSYSLNLHFCQNKLAGIGLFEKSNSCSKDAKTSCASKLIEQSTDDKKDCCHNEQVQIEKMDVDFLSSIMAELVDYSWSFYTHSAISQNDHSINISGFRSYKHYRPPPLPDQDFQIIYQTFLI